MIFYFPEIYPDELVYSWFSRYYVHSGFLSNKHAMLELLFNRHNNLSKEFIGHLNADSIKLIKKLYPIKNLILENTMFPEYARFIPLNDKNNAIYRLQHDFCDPHHLFTIVPRVESDSYLKYCPICVNEDRDKYGETYWHRTHQIRNMVICPKHNCRLISSSVTAKSEHTFTFCPAEEIISEETIVHESNSGLIDYNRYLSDVFDSKMDFGKDVPISDIIYTAMKENGYISSTGKTKRLKHLSDDLKFFYEDLGINDIATFNQIQRLLSKQKYDFTVICQIAFYLKVSAKSLIGKDFRKELSKATQYKKKKISLNWSIYDELLSPVLEQSLKELYFTDKRPEFISKRFIFDRFGLNEHRLSKLPKCLAVTRKYTETYEENWARRIVWAYNKLKCENRKFFWSDIRDLSGVKKSKLNKVIPYITKKTNTYNADEIIQFLNNHITP